MTMGNAPVLMKQFLKEKVFAILSENSRLIARFILASLFIYMAVWFFIHERDELRGVKDSLSHADSYWIAAGLMLVIVYLFAQGLMYYTSFLAVNVRVSLKDAVILFLKRNFISVFLPAGGVSSMVFFSKEIEEKGITKTQVYLASSIYAFVGILTVIIVAIPALLLFVSGDNATAWYAVAGIILILAVFFIIYRSLLHENSITQTIRKIFPSAMVFIEDLKNNRINHIHFINTVLISTAIEIIGILMVYLAIKALDLDTSVSTVIMAYIIAVLFLAISPFLRGFGAIEFSMSYFLIKSGYSNVDAISITLLFRFYEFWTPLFAGVIAFVIKVEKLLLRLFPAILIFVLGLVNIISVLTPALPERLTILRDYLLIGTISFSNSFVLVAGLLLMVTAAFMLRGLRTAWWFAILLSLISVFGHIAKGIDYEESIVALLVTFSLLVTRKEYYVKSNPKIGNAGLQTALFSAAAVIIFGTVGFYFLDVNHFHKDFNIIQSLQFTVQNFFLLGSRELVAYDTFGRDFINLIRISGVASMTFLIYSVARPYVYRSTATEDEKARAAYLISKYGNSSLDYFKTYSDKFLFTPPDINAFISYRVSRNYAAVLENPVAENSDEMKKCLIAFSSYCYENGMKEFYYRVSSECIQMYKKISMKSLLIGQEGILDLQKFTLEGGDKKSIRNALKKTKDQGYAIRIYCPPLRGGLVQKLKSVSDDWLKFTGRDEIVFSQGKFVEDEIKQQTVIAVENAEEKIVCFLNIIPDFAENEGTYDLLRKTADAPNGVVDFILVELFNYFREKGIRYVNLGFAPMSGIDEPTNFPEKSMKFAYERIRSFSHYKGLREYKEKFSPEWKNKYLVYRNDYDLFRIPAVLARVIKP
jgi:phosphatidylglycerol lysyltransferase